MKAKMKTIGLAMVCAIAASTASADLKLKWFGVQDGNWWTPGNWWDTSAETAEGYTYHEGYPGAYLSSGFSDEYSFPSIEFGVEINSNPGELDLNWGTLITSHTTIDLGGSAKQIKVSGDIKSSYDGRKGWGGGDYDGGPITFTNGTIEARGSLVIDGNDTEHFAVLQLKDVTLTCNKIELNSSGGRRKGRLILDGNTSVTANWFGCSYKGSEEGCVELNGGTLNVPTFSYVNQDWNGHTPLLDENGTTNINMTLVFNGGTLKASLNNLMAENAKKIEVNGYYDWDQQDSPFVPEWMKVEIGERGIVIDTEDAAGNSYDLTFAATNVTRASGVTTDGGLTKKGNGKLTVTEGMVWNGPTKVLGGTLDLNGGTITGPLVLGGNGRIVNATINTTDITIQSDYVFDATMWDIIGTASVTISGAVSITSPLNSILKSATAWYDPSDTSVGNLTTDGNGGVTAIKNKSATGDSMNAVLAPTSTENDQPVYNPPTTTTINDRRAIKFSGTPGFISAGAVSFDDPKGKSIFAVAQLNYENYWSNGVYPIAMCSEHAWNHSGVFSMKLGMKEFKSFYRVKPQVSGGDYTTTEMKVEGDDTIGNDNFSYVMSLRGSDAKDNENYNVFSRIIGKDGTLDEEQKEGVELSFDEENPTWGTKDVISYGFNNNSNGFSNQGAVGEALAFARCLSDEEAEVVQSYLVNKWVSSSIPATWPLEIGTLTLDGDVDFNGGNVTIGNLSGNGSITGSASLKVTGTITAKVNSTIAVTGDVDLTGATFAVDAALAESLAYNQSVTLLTSTGTISGFGSPVVLTVDTSKFKVRKSNGAITVTRLRPGLAIVFR